MAIQPTMTRIYATAQARYGHIDVTNVKSRVRVSMPRNSFTSATVITTGRKNRKYAIVSMSMRAVMGNNANKLTNKLKIFTKLFIVSEKVATKVND